MVPARRTEILIKHKDVSIIMQIKQLKIIHTSETKDAAAKKI